MSKIKRYTSVTLILALMLGIFLVLTGVSKGDKKDFIKYAEFNVCYSALEKALEYDINTHKNDEKVKIDWVQVLAYLGAKYGGDFKQYKEADLEQIVNRLKNGDKIKDITKDMKYYDYYHQVYSAVLGGFTGWYNAEVEDENGKITEVKDYGLCVFSPIAKTFPFSHYDDFGTGRSYGYKRRHLGHDLMAATGTPVVAIETGTVEIMGWNQYGGWRIGIRSLDKKRYYYYAHLRQNRPFNPNIKEGAVVKAGEVIGYVGRTGYSTTENTNNIDTSHLHLGMELIFDESQKECDNEIWVDLYAITTLLEKHKSTVYRVNETKEFYNKYKFSTVSG
ncbi:M23 family metallopeptidase [Oscillospiraceae bacterium LCP25S3_E10]|nr:M23 family metallopeptidase [Ruminococcus sp.]MDD6447086.1 M23 family metallopeptidase [Ruminococcus sp.]MDY2855742.1 M23 family metallopeptidase [Oscillospiraceae bacterium]